MIAVKDDNNLPVYFTRGKPFYVALSGTGHSLQASTEGGGEDGSGRVGLTKDLRSEIRRGEAVRVGGEWFRVNTLENRYVRLHPPNHPTTHPPTHPPTQYTARSNDSEPSSLFPPPPAPAVSSGPRPTIQRKGRQPTKRPSPSQTACPSTTPPPTNEKQTNKAKKKPSLSSDTAVLRTYETCSGPPPNSTCPPTRKNSAPACRKQH